MSILETITKADFLIIGAMKAGTTSLVDILNQHTNISIPKKELYFFSQDKIYSKGYEWYAEQLKSNSKNKKELVGEKCVSYSYVSKSAQRIQQYNQNIKFIWILRNPTERTYSNYLHNYYNGIENLSFENALIRESERIKDNIYLGYKCRSNYINQINNYLNYFDINQFLFVEFEDFISNNKNVLNKILLFLNVEQQELNYAYSNRTKKTIFPSLIFKIISKYGYWSLAHRIIRLLRYPKILSNKSVMKSSTRTYLNNFFSSHNKRLTELIKIDCSNWN